MSFWTGGAIVVLLCLLVVAELIATTPKSGGVHALISHAYGPYPGFLIGWTDWLLTMGLITVSIPAFLCLKSRWHLGEAVS